MSTSFILESGYSSCRNTKTIEIFNIITEITSSKLLKKCKELGIEKFKPENNTFEEYCEHYTNFNKGYFLTTRNDGSEYIRFPCAGGGDHRYVAEFVVKTLCLLVVEIGIKKNMNIDFRSL